MIDIFIDGQNRSSIPKNMRYSAPVNVNDNSTAIAEMMAVCRIGDKFDIVTFMNLFIGGDRLNGYADAWLIGWYELASNISKNGPFPS
tara:strand:+ start:372 stop:635 length:264 start_codon:yes stop_codon:yes gene_type:complete